MTRENLINTLKANTENKENGTFAVVLHKKEYYSKKVFNDVITMADTYEEAKAITNKLATKFANELEEVKASVTFATARVFFG